MAIGPHLAPAVWIEANSVLRKSGVLGCSCAWEESKLPEITLGWNMALLRGMMGSWEEDTETEQEWLNDLTEGWEVETLGAG